MAMMEGTLLDLVPYDARFEKNAVTWVNGPMSEWWGVDGLMTQGNHDRHQQEFRQSPHFHRFVRFGLLTKDGTPIGSFSLMRMNYEARQAEVGAGIGDPAFWGGGYGSDGMLLTVEYAVRWLGLRRLYLVTRADNFRAQRQVEKCGFTREGIRRDWVYYGGRHYDMVAYGLLESEWPGYAEMVSRLGLAEKAPNNVR